MFGDLKEDLAVFNATINSVADSVTKVMDTISENERLQSQIESGLAIGIERLDLQRQQEQLRMQLTLLNAEKDQKIKEAMAMNQLLLQGKSVSSGNTTMIVAGAGVAILAGLYFLKRK